MVIGVGFGASNQPTKQTASNQQATSTTTTPPQPGVSIPIVAPGAALTEATPCPAEDGSSPRTTTFIGPPPMCIDPGFFYTATITTSEGDMVVNINPRQAPQAANNFVVLSRYHFYDGQPISEIMPRTAFAVGANIDNPAGIESPGYTVASETPEQGQVFMFGSIAMTPVSETNDDFSAAFVIATYENAINLSQELTQFGFVVEGDDTVQAIDKSGNPSGQATRVITIDSITISKGVAINVASD